MDRDATQYVSLLKSFLDGEVSAEEFQAKYIDMFKTEIREFDPSLFVILDALFGDVDSLVLNPALMAELESQNPGFYLSETSLRQKVSVAYEKLLGLA
jgi:hypothetical protein